MDNMTLGPDENIGVSCENTGVSKIHGVSDEAAGRFSYERGPPMGLQMMMISSRTPF